MRSFLFSLIFIFAVSGCSSMKSGQYVYIESPSQMNTVARNYGVTVQELKNANPQKNFQKEWIFIPSRVGLAYIFNDTHAIQDYAHLGTGRFAWPVPGFYRISSHFGKRGSRNHDGIDIPGPKGTPIVASDSGTVAYSDNGIRGYGNLIVIAHGEEVFTVYAHNRKNLVKKGDRVKRGQKIAELGNTGRSTGPHLHFEIRVKNKVRNPAQYLSKKD